MNFQNHGGSHAKPDDCPEIESDDFERLTPQVTAFFAEERKALFRLKDLLVNGDAARSKTMTVQEEIGTILARREYLYLHFPDGYECKPNDISFLKRVRSEIDFFLKDMRD